MIIAFRSFFIIAAIVAATFWATLAYAYLFSTLRCPRRHAMPLRYVAA